MSYTVYLEDDDGEIITVPSHIEGSIYAIGGSDRAELDVTYNYSEVYRLFAFTLKDLHGHRAVDMVPILDTIVKKCGTDTYGDYWAPTPGNAGHALSILLRWATDHPDAVFRVD